jgi:hypothetical protein
MRSLAILLALTATVHAEPVETTTHYYEYTLTADAVGLALYAGGSMSEGPDGRDTRASSALMTIGVASSFLATPIIHAARGHWGRAGASFGLRYGVGMLSAIVAIKLSTCDQSKDFLCQFDNLGPGLGVGLAIASVVDAATMTEEKTAGPTAWAPSVTARNGGMMLGLGKAF